MQQLGHHVTATQIDEAMFAQGFLFYREHFMWGNTAAYRNRAGTIHRFCDHGDILSPKEFYERLLATWRPVAREEVAYAADAMRQELLGLQAAEDASTSDVAEQLALF